MTGSRLPERDEGAGTPPAPVPYRTTPVFDHDTLPAALRREHSTKAGVWGVVRVLEGRVQLTYLDGTAPVVVTPEAAAVVRPGQAHFVAPLGPVRMCVEFYDRAPSP